MQKCHLIPHASLSIFKIAFLSQKESVRNNGFTSFQLIQPGSQEKKANFICLKHKDCSRFPVLERISIQAITLAQKSLPLKLAPIIKKQLPYPEGFPHLFNSSRLCYKWGEEI